MAFDKGNLAIIQEELMIEEGCENELEKSRQTIQGIRQSRRQELSTVVEEPRKLSKDNSSNTSKSKSGSKSGSNNS